MKNESRIDPKIDQNLFKNRPKSVPKALLGALGRVLGAILAPRWPKRPQDPSKEPLGKIKKRGLGPKILLKSIKNGDKIDLKTIIVLIDFWIDFWSILEPTWAQLGSQNPPNMEPSWLPKAIQEAINQNHKNIKENNLYLGTRLPGHGRGQLDHGHYPRKMI